MLIFLKAFFVGGLICVIGQILIDVTKMTPARILVTFVVLGVILGATGVYDKLVDFAGAGATVPLERNQGGNPRKRLARCSYGTVVCGLRRNCGGGVVGTCGFVFCKTEKQIKNTCSKAECS